MDLNRSYWQGKEPKTSEELRDQIKKALLSLRQWKNIANIPSSEDSIMIEAQIFWLEQLLKIADIELQK